MSDDISERMRVKLEYGVMRRPEYGPLWLDLASRTLQVAGSDASKTLTPNEYQVMWLLVRARGSYVSDEEMLEFLSHDRSEYEDMPLGNVVGVYIGALRKKIYCLTNGKVVISTLHGLGYLLEHSE